jgi:hypothetical protein
VIRKVRLENARGKVETDAASLAIGRHLLRLGQQRIRGKNAVLRCIASLSVSFPCMLKLSSGDIPIRLKIILGEEISAAKCFRRVGKAVPAVI